MRFRTIIFVLVLITNIFIKANDCNYKLILSNNNYDIHVGDLMTISLTLSGEGIINLNKSIIFDLMVFIKVPIY
jgi:hypothetical protein